jgi:hypothetical protein
VYVTAKLLNDFVFQQVLILFFTAFEFSTLDIHVAFFYPVDTAQP